MTLKIIFQIIQVTMTLKKKWITSESLFPSMTKRVTSDNMKAWVTVGNCREQIFECFHFIPGEGVCFE